MPRDYRQWKVFHSADALVLRIYQATRSFPREEMFGLTSQLRRAAVSVPGNIVEGSGRESEKDFRRHVSIAYGSLAEVGYYIDLSRRLGYLDEETASELHGRYEETSRMLNGLLRKLSE